MAETINEIKSSLDQYLLSVGQYYIEGQHFYGMKGDASGQDGDQFKIAGAGPYEVKYGKRMSMPEVTRNPSLEGPKVYAQKYFGALNIAKIDMDGIVPKAVAVHISPQHGSATNSFGFQNLPAFSGVQSLSDIVTKVITGSTAAVTDVTLISKITDAVRTVASLTGAQAGSLVEMQRLDHMLPVQMALSTLFHDGENMPFDTSVFTKGLSIAAEVQAHLQQLAGGQANFQNILNTVSILSQTAGLNSITNVTNALSALGSNFNLGNSLANLNLGPANVINMLGQTLGNIPGASIVNEANQIIGHIVKAAGKF